MPKVIRVFNLAKKLSKKEKSFLPISPLNLRQAIDIRQENWEMQK